MSVVEGGAAGRGPAGIGRLAREAVVLAALAGAVMALAWIGIELPRELGRAAPIWTANAVALAVVLAAPRRRWPWLLGAAVAGNLAANMLAGNSLALTTAFSVCNGLEVALAAVVIQRLIGRQPDFSRGRDLIVFCLVAGLATPLLSSLAAATLLGAVRGDQWALSMLTWAAADSLGMMIVVPVLLTLRNARAYLADNPLRWPGAGALALLAVVTCVVFTQQAPLLFLIAPFLLLVVFRMEILGAVLGVSIVAVIGGAAQLSGLGPGHLSGHDVTSRLLAAQVFLAVMLLASLPTAAALAQRRRLQAALGQALAGAEAMAAEAAEQNRRLQMAEVVAGIGYYRHDMVNRSIAWSERMSDIFGFERGAPQSFEAILGRYHPDDREPMRRGVRGAIEGGLDYEGGGRLVMPDGEVRHIHGRSTFERGPDGAATAMVGIVMDVTTQRRAEAALADSEARFRSLAENATDMLIKTTLDGELLYISPAVREISGYEPEELIGRSSLDLVHPDDKPVVMAAAEACIRGGGRARPERVQYRCLAKDGRTVWVEARPTALVDPATGRVVALTDALRDITDRKAAEAALADSEDRIKHLAENVSDVILRTNIDGTLDYISPSVETLLGYPADELIGGENLQLVAPEDREQVKELMLTCLRTGGRETPSTVQYRSLTRDGRILWLESRPRPIVDPTTGRITAMTDIVRDITDRKAAEAALAESETRFRQLAESASDVIVRVNTAGIITYLSPSVRRYGYEPEQLVGRPRTELIHPDDVGRADGLMDDALAGGTVRPSQAREHRLKAADGTWRWIEGSPSVIRDASGAPLEVVSALRDVTERRATQDALAESEARFRQLAEHTSDVTFQVDADDIIRYVSPSCRRYGYEPEEIVGKPRTVFMHPEDREGAERVVGDMLAGDDNAAISDREGRIPTKSGEWRWVEANPSTIRDEDGVVIGVVSVMRDITERKAMEAELRAARVAAEAAAAVKGEFLANMSHELRTPLTSVLGFTRLALEQPELSETSRAYIGKASRAGASLLTTVNDILDFSKLEAGQVEIRPRAVDPAQVCRESVELFEQAAAEKGIALSFTADALLPDGVSLDPDRLRQLLLNLVGNAVKFSEAGAVSVEAGWSDGELSVSVRDNGPGIGPEQQALLFRRFSQVDGSSTRRHGGTGLGLAICKGLIEAMDGDIGVDSIEGHGARFFFTLPAPLAAAEEDAAESDAAAVVLRGARVLVVDDHAVNRELVRAVLSPLGAAVSEACGGAEAVEMASDNPYNLILMDLRMPGMDGRAAVQAIRAGQGPNADAAILAFSAGAESLDEAARRSAGFDGALAKPMLPVDLIAAVARYTSCDWEDADDGETHAA